MAANKDIFNASLCDEDPTQYKLCPPGDHCTLRTTPCDDVTEIKPIHIETIVIVSAIVLVVVVFLVVTIVCRRRWNPRGLDINTEEKAPVQHPRSRLTRLSPKMPANIPETDRIGQLDQTTDNQLTGNGNDAARLRDENISGGSNQLLVLETEIP